MSKIYLLLTFFELYAIIKLAESRGGETPKGGISVENEQMILAIFLAYIILDIIKTILEIIKTIKK